jgi:hypothetical protein
VQYTTTIWTFHYTTSNHTVSSNWTLTCILYGTSCISVRCGYTSSLHYSKQPLLDAHHTTNHHAISTKITLQLAIYMGQHCIKYTAWIQLIFSQPQNNTPMQSNNSRSFLQEATMTRHVIGPIHILFYSSHPTMIPTSTSGHMIGVVWNIKEPKSIFVLVLNIHDTSLTHPYHLLSVLIYIYIYI